MKGTKLPNYILAEKDYMSGMKYKEIAEKYGVSVNTVKSWKTRYKWDKKSVHTKDKKVCTQKRGAPVGNKNAVGNEGGAPKQNKNAEVHGFFTKYLPEETLSIIQDINNKDPLDILWENIELAYAAIVRAQHIAYVKNNEDDTIIKSGYKDGKVIGEDFLVQTAIDKQSKFMQAQSRAQGELRSLIKQYDEMLHRNWELATELQKVRIESLRHRMQGDNKGNDVVKQWAEKVKKARGDTNA